MSIPKHKNPEIKHDIVYSSGKYTSRIRFWMCKCGATGNSLKTMHIHQDEIQLERVQNLANAVENA